MPPETAQIRLAESADDRKIEEAGHAGTSPAHWGDPPVKNPSFGPGMEATYYRGHLYSATKSPRDDGHHDARQYPGEDIKQELPHKHHLLARLTDLSRRLAARTPSYHSISRLRKPPLRPPRHRGHLGHQGRGYHIVQCLRQGRKEGGRICRGRGGRASSTLDKITYFVQ